MASPRTRANGLHDKRNVRLIAVQSLLKWFGSNQIDYLPRHSFDKPTDYTFYKYLVSDVIRHKSKYLFYIKKLTGKPDFKLDAEVIVCLMLGLSQLESGAKTEAYAAINETVELLVLLKKPYLKGFVNANLRRFTREQEKLANQLEKQPISIKTSHDYIFIKRWIKQYGEIKTRAICESNNLSPEVQLVINPAFDYQQVIDQLIEEGFILDDTVAPGLIVKNPAGLFSSPLADKGCFMVQDKSFQRLNKFLTNLPKSSVLDVCSAPGGKLIHLDWEFKDEINLLVGCELKSNRLTRLKENVDSLGSRAVLIQADALNLPFKQSFELVVLDAPCSGTGTIRKHPEIKWSRTEIDLLTNQKMQVAMLNSCSRLVGSNGHLLYVTCSLEYEENQAVIQQFLETTSSFEMVSLHNSNIETSWITAEGFYLSLPTQYQMGCFAALLRNKN